MEVRLEYHGNLEKRVVHFDLGFRNSLRMLYKVGTFKWALENESLPGKVKLKRDLLSSGSEFEFMVCLRKGRSGV